MQVTINMEEVSFDSIQYEPKSVVVAVVVGVMGSTCFDANCIP